MLWFVFFALLLRLRRILYTWYENIPRCNTLWLTGKLGRGVVLKILFPILSRQACPKLTPLRVILFILLKLVLLDMIEHDTSTYRFLTVSFWRQTAKLVYSKSFHQRGESKARD